VVLSAKEMRFEQYFVFLLALDLIAGVLFAVQFLLKTTKPRENRVQ